MRFSPRTWSLLSLLLFVAAVFFWLKGNEYEARKRKTPPPAAVTNAPGTVGNLSLLSPQAAGVQLAQLSTPGSASSTSPSDEQIDKLYPDRLRNTKKPLQQLVSDDHAILLANALIDTASGEPLHIPEHLRANGDPGSYIVQWNGPATAEFRARLAEAGAEIISYVPNNAYFVRVDAPGARQLEQSAGVQAVLPFEPYYKLQQGLLAGAVRQELLPEDAVLRLTLLPGSRDAAVRAVALLGAELFAEESSPFGPQLVVHPPVDALAALAKLSVVQGIEVEAMRKAASDLSRIALGVATNSSGSNYLNLSGSNIWVNINDTGIDPTHPALLPVTISVPLAPIPMAGTDPDGHGTFVASMIAGGGAQSPTNAPGSPTNAVMRGMAPLAKLLALPLSGGGGTNKYPALNEKVLDSWLIDLAARTNYLTLRRTNSLISNNSWTYARPGYDSAAARFDAAVRDAIPGMTGSQPLLFVFAAGNSGFGNDEGGGGQVDTIESPGTAKNVITVGALENFRLVTNVYYTTTNREIDEFTGVTNETVITNYPFAASTDSSNQVAAFSSRGNVGIGLEGTTGRFKPDVVAPGTMLLAARSRGWNFNGFNTNESDPFGNAFFNVNTNIQPYRFDNGTTFAAANVSGMLALLQQYFESLAPDSAKTSLSPALMKALLINGARSLTELYDLAVQKAANLQGWGLPSLPNMLTSYSTNSHATIDPKKWRLRMVEQSASNALATGQSRTWTVTVSSNALVYPLRVTLAYTDPPGNPAVAVKLVNDLDLVVTNLQTGTVFYGNDIPSGADFTTGVIPVQGSVEPHDFVNNVETVAIRNPKELGTNGTFSITVRARRVNVNSLGDYLARTGNTNDVVQDFALVVSSDIGSDPAANDPTTYLPNLDVFDAFDVPNSFTSLPRVGLTPITNGLPLLNERVGANATLVGTNGITNQWNFYVFTNVTVSNSLVYAKAGPHVAFVTFSPPNLAKPRNLEADIDLYVSRDSRLTNLDPVVVNAAATFRQRERGGTETVSLTNAVIGEIFYVAVKAEDQQGAEFSLIGVSSEGGFEDEQENRSVLRGVPIYSYVPDGSARLPVAGRMLAVGVSNKRAARTVVEDTIVHENFGDLVGVLSHGSTAVILNNHAEFPPGRTNFTYDDSSFYPPGPGVRRTDGPGSLNDFAGLRIAGAWFLEMIDNAPSHTGRVESLTITIDHLRDPLISGNFYSGRLRTNETAFFPIEVGPGVTNLTFQITNSLPIEVYFRQFELPTTNLYDLKLISTNFITFSFPTTNSAPLSPGTHYLALRNTNSFQDVAFRVRVDFGFGSRPGDTFNFTGQAPRPFDEATTNTTIFVQNDKLVARAQVSVHMDYPRMSDLVLSLISPQGTRLLLSENRGGSNTGFGATTIVTNQGSTNPTTVIAYTIFTDDTNIAQLPIKFAVPTMVQNRTNIGLISSNNFESIPPGPIFDSDPVEGPWVALGFPEVIAQGAFTGTNTLEFIGVEGDPTGIYSDVTTLPGRTYRVTFASRVPGRDYLYWTERNGNITNSGTNLLYRMAMGSTNVEPLLTNIAIGAFGGVSVDVLGGYLYSGDRQFLFRTDLVGRQRTNLVATQNAVTDVEVDTANDWVYWAESGTFTRTNSIKRARRDGKGVQVLFQISSGQISGIALDAARNLLYYTFSLNVGRDSIQSIDLGTLGRRVVSTLPNATVDPFDIDLDPVSQTLVFNQIGDRSFWRMGPNGTPLTRIFTNAFETTNGLALDTALQQIIFNAKGTIYKRGSTGSNLTEVVRNRLTVNYEEVAHGVQGSGGARTPLTAQVIFGGTTNSLIGTTDWTSNTFYFVGRGGSQRLTLRANEGGIWVDNVIVERVPDTFVLPEEPLQTIVGQRAIGEWRLEVQDSRTGAFLPPGSYDWKLDLNLADPIIFAETLTGGSRFSLASRSTLNSTNRFTPGVLRSNQVHFFIIQPCAGARELTVFLGGVRNFEKIDLLADSSGIPTGNAETDDFVLMRNNQNPPSANGTLEFRLSDRLPAPARLTAKPIFIAIRNSFQDVTNIYNLMVASDGGCAGNTSLSQLTANQSEVSGLAGFSEYSANQMGLHYMNIPSGAQSVSVNVEGDADVSIIAQKDEPPTTESFSHFQNVPGSANELMTISSESGVPLTPGVWYVRVLNNTENPISYTITATGDLVESILSVQVEVLDGQVQLSWNATEGATYEVQATADFDGWVTVAELPEGTSVFALPDPFGPARFYRVLQK